MAHLVPEDPLDLVGRELGEEGGRYRDECAIAGWTRREGIGLVGLVDADLGHADAAAASDIGDGGEEELLTRRVSEHLALGEYPYVIGRPRDPPRDEETDDRPREAEHEREDKHSRVSPIGESARDADASEMLDEEGDEREDEDDGEIGEDEESDAAKEVHGSGDYG